MIFIQNEILFKDPLDFNKLPVTMRNLYRRDLELGRMTFEIPKEFDSLSSDLNIKKHKTVYKVGFLYELLTIVYPELGKKDKQIIIADKYHFWFTYRQFKDINDFYEKSRGKYIKNRSLLGSFK